MIGKFENLNDYKDLVIDSGIKNKLIIIDFTAKWCGPCQKIAPFFEELSNKEDYLTKCSFYKVDVDEYQDISEYCGINSMPTFQFYFNGKKVDELIGANTKTLIEKINNNMN